MALAFSARTATTLRVHASAQGIHQIDDLRWRTLFRCFDLLTRLGLDDLHVVGIGRSIGLLHLLTSKPATALANFPR
jgi:hypothetical protein